MANFISWHDARRGWSLRLLDEKSYCSLTSWTVTAIRGVCVADTWLVVHCGEWAALSLLCISAPLVAHFHIFQSCHTTDLTTWGLSVGWNLWPRDWQLIRSLAELQWDCKAIFIEALPVTFAFLFVTALNVKEEASKPPLMLLTHLTVRPGSQTGSVSSSWLKEQLAKK